MSIDTTPSFIPSLNQRYMESILGQRTPFDLRDLKDDSSLVVTPPTSTTQDLQSSLVLFSILQADSLWSQGDSAKSREILLQSRILRNDNGTEKKNIATGSTPLYLMHFARGLMQLLDGALILAYESFTNASKNAPREELVSVFLAERAANVSSAHELRTVHMSLLLYSNSNLLHFSSRLPSGWRAQAKWTRPLPKSTLIFPMPVEFEHLRNT